MYSELAGLICLQMERTFALRAQTAVLRTLGVPQTIFPPLLYSSVWRYSHLNIYIPIPSNKVVLDKYVRSSIVNTGKAFHVALKARKKIIRLAKPDKLKKKAVNPYSVMSFVSIK